MNASQAAGKTGIERAKITYEIAPISAIGRRDRRHGQGLGQGDHRADQPAALGYLPVSTSALSIIGCALHVPHSGALSQIVPKSWLE
jgi:hypothetical protein